MTDLPPYTYIPGRSPHPISDPAGHSYGARADSQASIRDGFEHGLKLFNHGYYWEAHEAWEGVWIALGRTGPQADFLKGLIKLAACGVKCLEGNETGARRHLRRASELFNSVKSSLLQIESFNVNLGELTALMMNLDLDMPVQNTAEQMAMSSVEPILGLIQTK